MIDIQHDSPVPIHEQIIGQIMAHVASSTLKPGTRLREYRSFAQELLTNPQVVARAYGDLEWLGVLRKSGDGVFEVAPNAEYVCRMRLQELARKAIRDGVAKGLACGLTEADIQEAVRKELSAAKAPPLPAAELSQAIQKSTHERRNRDSQGIQDLSRQTGPGSS